MTGGCGPGQAGGGVSRGGIRGRRDARAEVVVCRVSAETRSLDKGVVLYDGQCGFRSRWVWYWAGTLAWRGFKIASLDVPWVAQKIKMPREELLTDIRFITLSRAQIC